MLPVSVDLGGDKARMVVLFKERENGSGSGVDSIIFLVRAIDSISWILWGFVEIRVSCVCERETDRSPPPRQI